MIAKRGSALIEFALVLPIVLLLVFGIIEFSAMFYNKAVITNASREGARYGVIIRSPSYATSTQIIAYTKAYSENKLISFGGSSPTVTVTVTPSASPATTGDTLKVGVSFVYTNLVILNLLGLGSTKTISAETTMTYE